MGQLAGPENILIVALNQPRTRQYAGKRLSEIAKLQNKDWLDTAMDLVLTEHRRVETIYFMMSEDNVRAPAEAAVDQDRHRQRGRRTRRSARRTWRIRVRTARFPRILGKYVREKKMLPLEEAVRKMTSATARRLSIRTAGCCRRGCSRTWWSSIRRRSATGRPTSSRISCRRGSGA